MSIVLPLVLRVDVRKIVSAALCAALGSIALGPALAAPKVVVISLDGATPRLVRELMRDGTIPHDQGLGIISRHGVVAERNITVNPSLTAVAHIAIATGSTAASNDIAANTFHLAASPFKTNISGFAAPIGGYSIHGPAESDAPTAEPLWVALRGAKRSVVTATFPGGDGLDVTVPGLPGNPVVQPSANRTVNYTVPFGAFAGAGGKGFVLHASDFAPAPGTTLAQLSAAGRSSFSPVQQSLQAIDTFTVGGVSYRIMVAALDSTDDGVQNYDTLVFFDQTLGIQPGPFALPATGPAYVKASGRRSALFYLEGSSNKAGTAFYVSALAADLSTIHIARYSANAIPRNPPVLADVDDINTHVGFWAPQADFRFPERINPGLDAFADVELEAIFEDQVALFVDYQTRVALRAIERNSQADLVMVYIEQPDGSEHQFLLTDPRQAANPRDANTIGGNQDAAKRARYRSYLQNAYSKANQAVQRILEAIGIDPRGRPRSDVFVVSDHGFAPFHTAVNLNAYLTAKGFDPNQVRAVTSGPAANIYINLKGREADGIVTPEQYVVLQRDLIAALRDLADINPHYVSQHRPARVFSRIHARPVPADLSDPTFGLGTDSVIGQDFGDVFTTLAIGYNFDGVQVPAVQRLDDDASATPVLSVPNFYGAHGYDPRLPEMSAIFFAAGPHICRRVELETVHNIDLAPTILKLLDVEPHETVQGRAIDLCRHGDDR
jgi:predicted AlkP superfamily pyrophosphatase or phosphodiesterase